MGQGHDSPVAVGLVVQNYRYYYIKKSFVQNCCFLCQKVVRSFCSIFFNLSVD